jgi:hypothetical protein
MTKYSLTEEHRAQFDPWAKKWIANALSTKPMDDNDQAETVKAINGQYAAAGLKSPRIVFVPSPLVARFACGFASWIWYQRGLNAKNADAATYAATDAATDAATRAATDAATHAATRAATDAATDAATHAATRAATRAATDAANLSKWYLVIGDLVKLANDLGVGEAGIKCAELAWKQWRGNNQWSGWAAYLSFFRHVAKLPIDYSKWDYYEKACIHAGPMFMHAEFCIVSDRPRVLKVDRQNRPHCADGPFCKWSDGFALYSFHGVRIPAWIIEKPERLTPALIGAEANAETRRVMIERYGQAKYLIDSGAKEIHSDDYGVLYSKEIPGDEPLVMVKVVNSTPELCAKCGGTHGQTQYWKDDDTPYPPQRQCVCGEPAVFKDYFLRVHPELRPMRSGGLGDRQPLTALNAVASTFGMAGDDYVLEMET